MIPNVEIMYSGIYDRILSGTRKYDFEKRIKGERFAKKLQKDWNKHEKEILTAMSRITGLKWPRKHIEAWVTFNTPFEFSHPLTLWIHRSMKYEIEMLVHELTHVLLWGNRKKVKWPESNTGIYKKYQKEHYNTLLHLSIHALVILTMKKSLWQECRKIPEMGEMVGKMAKKSYGKRIQALLGDCPERRGRKDSKGSNRNEEKVILLKLKILMIIRLILDSQLTLNSYIN